MAGGITNVASGVQTTDALLGLFRWNGLSLTYNFPDTAAYYTATYFTAGSVPSGSGVRFRDVRGRHSVARKPPSTR